MILFTYKIRWSNSSLLYRIESSSSQTICQQNALSARYPTLQSPTRQLRQAGYHLIVACARKLRNLYSNRLYNSPFPSIVDCVSTPRLWRALRFILLHKEYETQEEVYALMRKGKFASSFPAFTHKAKAQLV